MHTRIRKKTRNWKAGFVTPNGRLHPRSALHYGFSGVIDMYMFYFLVTFSLRENSQPL
jgi:hypothetical protein